MWQSICGCVIALGGEAERPRVGVAGLQLAACVKSMVRPLSRQGVPVLKRASSKPQAAQAVAQRLGGAVAGPAAARLRLAGVHDRLEERAGGQDDGAGAVERVAAGDDADDACVAALATRAAVFEQQPFDHLLPQRQVRLVLDAALHRELVELLVGLGARRVHRRALGAVEHAELDAGWRR